MVLRNDKNSNTLVCVLNMIAIHNTSVLSFHIDVVSVLPIENIHKCCFDLDARAQGNACSPQTLSCPMQALNSRRSDSGNIASCQSPSTFTPYATGTVVGELIYNNIYMCVCVCVWQDNDFLMHHLSDLII